LRASSYLGSRLAPLVTSMDVSDRPRQFLHSRTWVQGCGCTLLLWHHQSGLVDLCSLSDHDHCCSLARRVFGEFDSGALAIVGDHDVTEDGKDSIWCWHLHDGVGVMWYGHELGQ
jgi:hypothetical protein